MSLMTPSQSPVSDMTEQQIMSALRQQGAGASYLDAFSASFSNSPPRRIASSGNAAPFVNTDSSSLALALQLSEQLTAQNRARGSFSGQHLESLSTSGNTSLLSASTSNLAWQLVQLSQRQRQQQQQHELLLAAQDRVWEAFANTTPQDRALHPLIQRLLVPQNAAAASPTLSQHALLPSSSSVALQELLRLVQAENVTAENVNATSSADSTTTDDSNNDPTNQPTRLE